MKRSVHIALMHGNAWHNEVAEGRNQRFHADRHGKVEELPIWHPLCPQPVDERGGEERRREPPCDRAAGPLPPPLRDPGLGQGLLESALQGERNHQMVGREVGETAARGVLLLTERHGNGVANGPGR